MAWMFKYHHDEDTSLLPRLGAEADFAPTLTTHGSYYSGGPLVPVVPSDMGQPGCQVEGSEVRYRGSATVHKGEWFDSAVVDGVVLVLGGPHPYREGEISLLDGFIELDAHAIYSKPLAGEIASRWRFDELLRLSLSTGKAEPCRDIDTADETSVTYLLRCSLVRPARP